MVEVKRLALRVKLCRDERLLRAGIFPTKELPAKLSTVREVREARELGSVPVNIFWDI
jgi:hypothetical protein